MSTITLIPGDGIGPEITDAVVHILQEAGAGLEFEQYNAGLTAFREVGELLPAALLDSVKATRIALKGPITTPVGEGFKSINVTLRQVFDLYQNVRPCKSIPGLDQKFPGVDMVLFRENTEGLYAGLEMWDEARGIADAVARISRTGAERIARAAFEYAVRHGRKKVTIVHKANILKKTSGLFLRVAQEVAKDFPQIETEDRIIDNMAMQAVLYPSRYDVVVTTNLFGDILSDLGAALVGGLGIVPSANIGDDCAIFEAVHGSAPDIAGQGLANPTALLQSAILMLHHLGKHEVANAVEAALFKTILEPQNRTRDLGGNAHTMEFANTVVKNLV